MKKKNIDFQRITLVALLLTFVLCNMYNIILFFFQKWIQSIGSTVNQGSTKLQ